MVEKYYLKADFMDEEKEVSKQEYINAEQAAGFRSKFGPNAVATGSFAVHTYFGHYFWLVALVVLR